MQNFYNFFRQIIIYFLNEIFNTKDCIGSFSIVVPRHKAYEIIDWIKYCYAEDVDYHEFFIRYLEILSSIKPKNLKFVYSKFNNYTEKTASSIYLYYANQITSQGFSCILPRKVNNVLFDETEIKINNLVLFENLNIKGIKSIKDLQKLIKTFSKPNNLIKKIEKYLPNDIGSTKSLVVTYLLDFQGQTEEEQIKLSEILNQPL